MGWPSGGTSGEQCDFGHFPSSGGVVSIGERAYWGLVFPLQLGASWDGTASSLSPDPARHHRNDLDGNVN